MEAEQPRAIPIDYERLVQDLYQALLRPGDVAVDIGAHVGRHTLPLAHCVAPHGRVLAFEPVPACQETLADALAREPALADVVQLFACALSDHPCRAAFLIAEDALAFSGFRQVAYPHPSKLQQIDVDVDTLDRCLAAMPAVRYLKLDAEGAEPAILRGAVNSIARCRPVVSFEHGSSAQAYPSSTAELVSFWQQHDYRLFAITGEPLDERDFRAHSQQGTIWDYVAVPAEREDLVVLVAETLRRPRVNWLAIHAELQHAQAHSAIGAEVPPLQSVPRWLRPLGYGVAWLILKAANFITARQRLCNQALLAGVLRLAQDLERCEGDLQRRAQQLRALEERLARLERQERRVEA